MPRADDGSGGGPLGTSEEPPPPLLPVDDCGGGAVLIFGALVTLNACVAASWRMTCWRSASSFIPCRPLDTWATAAPSGSVAEPGRPATTSKAIATTTTVAAAAVTMKTPTRLRFGRLAGGRLRCCDNAVLPSAMRARRNARHADRCGTGQRVARQPGHQQAASRS